MTLTATLTKALVDNTPVSFDYDDKLRIVEIHAIGTSTKDGSVIMRGYQVAGVSSRPVPCWALFTVDKIENITPSFLKSEAPRQGYKMGDKQMREIIAELAVANDVEPAS